MITADQGGALPSVELLREVRDAVSYSYEAGDWPSEISPEALDYLAPDYGLLATLGLAVRLLEERQEALPQLRLILGHNAVAV